MNRYFNSSLCRSPEDDGAGGGGSDDHDKGDGSDDVVSTLKATQAELQEKTKSAEAKIVELEGKLKSFSTAKSSKDEPGKAQKALAAFESKHDTSSMTDAELKKFSRQHNKLIVAANAEEAELAKQSEKSAREKHFNEFTAEVIRENVQELRSIVPDLTEAQLKDIINYGRDNNCFATDAYFRMQAEKAKNDQAELTKKLETLEKQLPRSRREHANPKSGDTDNQTKGQSKYRIGSRPYLQEQRARIKSSEVFKTGWDQYVGT